MPATPLSPSPPDPCWTPLRESSRHSARFRATPRGFGGPPNPRAVVLFSTPRGFGHSARGSGDRLTLAQSPSCPLREGFGGPLTLARSCSSSLREGFGGPLTLARSCSSSLREGSATPQGG